MPLVVGILVSLSLHVHPPATTTHRPRIIRPRHRSLALVASTPAAETGLAFGAALAAVWNGESDSLAPLLDRDCRVQTPLWSCAGRAAYEKELVESRTFYSALSKPALTVLSHRPLDDGRVQLTWQLGVEWPAVWRPRVNILGESVLTLGRDGLVAAVAEEWHQTPKDVFLSQVLPKFRDVSSQWATPLAESAPLPVVGKGDGFELRRVPPMRCLLAEWIEVGQLLYVDQAPIPPYYAFSGAIKRTEWYNAVSPGFLERSFTTWELPGGMSQPGQRRRWFAPLPARFGNVPLEALPPLPTVRVGAGAAEAATKVAGDDADDSEDGAGGAEAAAAAEDDADDDEEESLPEEVVSASVQYVTRPSQLLATRRLQQIPSNDAVLSTALELAECAERAGYTVAKEGGRPVIVQISGDVKYGFNDKIQLAMSVWLSVPDSLRDEYVGVVVEP